MTVHLPTIKQLQYLVALRRHGHFGRAAEASFVTQSTLSAGIRELETLLAVSFTEGNGDPDPALYEPFADAALNCMDFGALLVQQFTSDGNLSEESATCLADAIPHDLLRDLIIVGMTDGDSTSAEAALTREITRAAPDCLTDEELASLGG